ncbi:hypothetical protein D5F01_LYC16506 [Larimichthys crocea]|uniref:Uncharacterized protein n=1 Tax=Larimichthys crocea TaxID=215358 RepID=A0A6G0I0P8_LARCR|nr:hypothetical protein D5F01_LYC16506 [Larimichthys crocea]
MPAEVKEEQSSEGPPPLSLSQDAKEATLDNPSTNDELDTPTSIASMMTSTNESSTETDTPLQTDTEESKAVEQEGEHAPIESQESSEIQQENFETSDTPDLTSTPERHRGEICAGYGSLSRASLHNYWPAKNFQPGAHYTTLPFLRDSYAPAGLSSQTEEDGLSERGENPLDMKTDHPGATYPTLGGIHQFRPITTMELLREPSRTR